MYGALHGREFCVQRARRTVVQALQAAYTMQTASAGAPTYYTSCSRSHGEEGQSMLRDNRAMTVHARSPGAFDLLTYHLGISRILSSPLVFY